MFLKWIFTFWNIITMTFVNIYIYKLFDSFEYVTFYNILLYTSLFIWFSFFWYFIWKFNINIKKLFYLSFLNFLISFLLLFFINSDFYWIIFFTLFYWIWMGNYYCSIQSYEIKDISDKKRDFYSSILSVWIKVLYIIVPLIVSLIFYLSDIFSYNEPYKLLFLLIPILYLLSLFFIKDLKPYSPIRVKLKSYKKFFNMKNKNILLYFLTDSITFTIPSILITILLIDILKTEITLWILQSLFSLFSIFLILLFSTKRNSNNRNKIMFYSWIIIFINFIFLWFNLNFIWLITYYIIDNIVSPFYKISVQIYDLKFISNIKYNKSDFFPSMIFRESILWFWRIFSLIIILIIIKYNPNNLENVFSYSFLILWFFYILSPLFIKLEENK